MHYCLARCYPDRSHCLARCYPDRSHCFAQCYPDRSHVGCIILTNSCLQYPSCTRYISKYKYICNYYEITYKDTYIPQNRDMFKLFSYIYVCNGHVYTLKETYTSIRMPQKNNSKMVKVVYGVMRTYNELLHANIYQKLPNGQHGPMFYEICDTYGIPIVL